VIFVCGVNKDFNVTEEVPALVLLRDTTRVGNLLESVTGNSDQVGMNSTDLSGVTLSPLNAEFYPICHLLALLGAYHILHVSRIRVNGASAVIGRCGGFELMQGEAKFEIILVCGIVV
jgi:hypothetical protein